MEIKTIGIMTGNSLDAADAVLSAFTENTVRDLASFSMPYPPVLRERFLRLKEKVKNVPETEKLADDPDFLITVEAYTRLAAETVNRLLAESGIEKTEIAAIGFHGQTCDHFPPSVAGSGAAYTLQVGDARLLAELTGIPVIYDFRSDDLMNGGEGAPLAPLHNLRLVRMLAGQGYDSAAFCNGGNTGNLAVVSAGGDICGWDTGPFNHLPDLLMRKYQKRAFDKDGILGAQGEVVSELLRQLFEQAAVTAEGKNFYLLEPPKSSDPHWYKAVYDERFSFADNLRTAEYLAAYGFVYNLCHLQSERKMPALFLLFGGGWKNPLVRRDFENLLGHRGLVLPEHGKVFADIYARLPQNPRAAFSDDFGFSGAYMEARIFADMAYSKIVGRPFSLPSTTGCKTPTVGGIYVLPDDKKEYLLTRLFKQYGNTAEPESNPRLWSRAAKGWQRIFAAGV